jgi:hypothetical protein
MFNSISMLMVCMCVYVCVCVCVREREREGEEGGLACPLKKIKCVILVYINFFTFHSYPLSYNSRGKPNYSHTGDGGHLQSLYPTKQFQLHRRLAAPISTCAIVHRQSSCLVTKNNVVIQLYSVYAIFVNCNWVATQWQ